MNVKKAVIPAAGLGTRFLPATKAMAKEMLLIVDKPTIQLYRGRSITIRDRRYFDRHRESKASNRRPFRCQFRIRDESKRKRQDGAFEISGRNN